MSFFVLGFDFLAIQNYTCFIGLFPAALFITLRQKQPPEPLRPGKTKNAFLGERSSCLTQEDQGHLSGSF